MNDEQLKIYFNILENKTHKEADKYKNTLLPTKIYKYVWLSDDEDKNEEKFKALEEDKIWCSRYTALNDPFEFAAIYIDPEVMKVEGYSDGYINIVMEFYEKTKDILRICSFSKLLNNMPLWAHYANNHRGFCIEYDINDGDKVFPIIYTENRKEDHAFFLEFINTRNRINNYERQYGCVNEDDLLNSLRHISYMYLANATKHYSWNYEKEYRVIFAKENPDEKRGDLIACNDCGLKAKKVFLGRSCKTEHINRLKEVSLRLKLEDPMQMCTGLDSKYELKPYPLI